MSLKAFVNNTAMYDAFLEELDAMIKAEHKVMEQVSEPIDLYRSQGTIFALKKLKKLREKVNV